MCRPEVPFNTLRAAAELPAELRKQSQKKTTRKEKNHLSSQRPTSKDQESRSEPLSDYIILIRNTVWQQDFSTPEIEKALDEFSAWVEKLGKDGRVKVAVPLVHQGKLLEGKDIIVDGPFVESKEVIAGLVIFQAESFEAATEIASTATCLNYGQTLELRPIATEEPERETLRARASVR
jgi:hypothetical protein